MKTKKLNRGLALGAALLVGLAGFVTFDYFNFKSNKEDIKSKVENYLNDCAKISVTEDGDCREAVQKLVNDYWGYNRFYSKSFVYDYTTADRINYTVDDISDNDAKRGHLTECKASVSDVKVSKAGPNLAQAEVKYSISFKGVGTANIMTVNGLSNVVFDSDNFVQEDLHINSDDKVFDDLEYEGSISYEDTATFYLEYDDGDWKLVGASGYTQEYELADKEGTKINLEKYSKGDKTPDKPDDNDKGDKTPVAVKLPDGTIVDIPEGEDLPADIKELPAGTEIIYADDDDKGGDSKGGKDESTAESKADKSSDDAEDLDEVEPNKAPAESESAAESGKADGKKPAAESKAESSSEQEPYIDEEGNINLARLTLDNSILNRGWR